MRKKGAGFDWANAGEMDIKKKNEQTRKLTVNIFEFKSTITILCLLLYWPQKLLQRLDYI